MDELLIFRSTFHRSCSDGDKYSQLNSTWDLYSKTFVYCSIKLPKMISVSFNTLKKDYQPVLNKMFDLLVINFHFDKKMFLSTDILQV